MAEAPKSEWSPFVPMPVARARAAQAELREACPMAEIAPNFFYVFRADATRAVLLDQEHFSNVGNFGADPNMPRFVTLLDPPEHTEVRGLLNRGFVRAAIVDAASWVELIVDELIDAFIRKEGADIVADFAMPLTERVISRLVGVPSEDSGPLARWSLEVTAMLPRPRFDTEVWARIEDYIETLLTQRRAMASPPDDIITGLMLGKVNGRALTTREITGHVWLLFVGGLESTAYTLSTLIHELLADREHWQKLLADRTLIPRAVEEGLRYTTPLRAVERQVAATTEIGGCPVNKGQTLFIGLESANFDEAYFGGDVSRFDFTRDGEARHMAFGFGRHLCLGAGLARCEISVALGRLLERVPTLRLADGFVFETVISQFSNIPKSVDVVWR